MFKYIGMAWVALVAILLVIGIAYTVRDAIRRRRYSEVEQLRMLADDAWEAFQESGDPVELLAASDLAALVRWSEAYDLEVSDARAR